MSERRRQHDPRDERRGHLRTRDKLTILVAPALPVLAVGACLLGLNRSWATSDEVTSASNSAGLLADAAIGPLFSAEDLASGALSPQRRAEVDERLTPILEAGVVDIKIWNAKGALLYHAAGEPSAAPVDVGGHLAEALAGDRSGHASTERDPATGQSVKVLEVYSPLNAGSDGAVDGAFELYLDFDGVNAGINRQMQRTLIATGLALLVLYAALAKIAADMARVRRRAAHHESAAHTDPLTGLCNRRGFERDLTAMLATDREELMALICIDLDGFKVVNDQLGHGAGDDLLINIAQRLRASVRQDATIARLGGDEFFVVLPRVSGQAEALSVGRRILERVNEPFHLIDGDVSVGASIGVATAWAHHCDAESLHQRADEAMYRAKEQGKNTIECSFLDPVEP